MSSIKGFVVETSYTLQYYNMLPKGVTWSCTWYSASRNPLKKRNLLYPCTPIHPNENTLRPWRKTGLSHEALYNQLLNVSPLWGPYSIICGGDEEILAQLIGNIPWRVTNWGLHNEFIWKVQGFLTTNPAFIFRFSDRGLVGSRRTEWWALGQNEHKTPLERILNFCRNQYKWFHWNVETYITIEGIWQGWW